MSFLLTKVFGLGVGRNEHGSIIVKGKRGKGIAVNFAKHECDEYKDVTDFGALLGRDSGAVIAHHLRACLCRSWDDVLFQYDDDQPAQLRIGFAKGWILQRYKGPAMNP